MCVFNYGGIDGVMCVSVCYWSDSAELFLEDDGTCKVMAYVTSVGKMKSIDDVRSVNNGWVNMVDEA